MEQDITFNKLITKLEEFQKRHPQLNSFGFGNLIEFGKDIDNTAPLYPLMFVVPQAITYEEPLTQYSLQIFFADRLNDDNDGSVSIVSSMSQIARDLLGTLKLNEDFRYLGDYDFPVTAAPFLERFNDVLAGVSITLNLNVGDYLDICQLNEYIDNTLTIQGNVYEPGTLIGLVNLDTSETLITMNYTGDTDVFLTQELEVGTNYRFLLLNGGQPIGNIEVVIGNETIYTENCEVGITYDFTAEDTNYTINVNQNNCE